MVSVLNTEILRVLGTKDEVKLNELYEIVGKHPDFTWDLSVRKHRVRSALDNLKRQNKVERSADRTYKLV
ncbi:hypothetical protein OAL59_01865 [Nitrosopumilus sp.]|jgi:hypothetical protein|nr:hypothetical protein [Nitrosopumilus sp.]